MPTAQTGEVPRFRDLGAACRSCGAPGAAEFEDFGDLHVENPTRGVTLNFYVRDISLGGPIQDPWGRPISSVFEYTNRAYQLSYPVLYAYYAHQTQWEVLVEGKVIRNSFHDIVCLPEDVLGASFTRIIERAQDTMPSQADVEQFLCELEGGFQCFSARWIRLAREVYDPNARLRVLGFEAFGGQQVTFPVDWVEVGRRASALFGAVLEGPD